MLSDTPMVASQAAMSLFLLEKFDAFRADGTLDELTQRPDGKPPWPQTLPSKALPKMVALNEELIETVHFVFGTSY